MPAPSNRTGIPAALVVALLAVVLLVGFGLGPHAFEFDAWPQPSREDKVEEVVARSAEEATEVPVVRVRDGERRRAREETLAVRGRDARRRGGPGRPELSVRSGGARDEARRGQRYAGRGRGDKPAGETATPVPDVVIVPDAPAPVPDVPVVEPEEPTRLAELAEPQSVLRPDAEAEPAAPLPKPRDGDGEVGVAGLVDLDGDGLLEDADRVLDSLLQGERDSGRRGRSHGHR